MNAMRIFFAAVALALLAAGTAGAACSGGAGNACYYSTNGSNTSPYDTWAKAATTLATAASQMAAGDVLYVADDSNEVSGSALTVTFPGTAASPNYIYVADHTVATPGTGDLKIATAGAGSVLTNASNAITLNGSFYWYGAFIVASHGVGGAVGSLNVANTGGNTQVFEQSTIGVGGTGGGIARSIGVPSSWTMINSNVYFGAAGSTLGPRGKFFWRGGTLAGTATPTTLFDSTSVYPIFLEGVDLSALSGTIVAANTTGQTQITIKDTRLHASVTVSAAQTGGWYNNLIDLVRSDSGTKTVRSERHDNNAVLTTQATTTGTLVRSGGASDGTTGYSWRIVSTARAHWVSPFVAPPISIWNSSTGGGVAVTLYGIADPRDFTALPLNDDIWFDVEYLGNASYPIGSLASGTKANNLATGSSLSASTEAWDANVAARADSTAYSIGNFQKVASNPGRVFVCTTAGTSAGSEPAGYASAVDGGSVTDGSAVFKAAWRWQLQVTTGTVNLAGPLTIYVKVGKPSLTGIFVDPKPSISGTSIGRTYGIAPWVVTNDPTAGTAGAQCIGC